MSNGIFHKRRGKIMVLTPLKARAGIAALTYAAVMATFALATPAKAVIIGFVDSVEDMVQLTVNGLPATEPQKEMFIERQSPEFMETKLIPTTDQLVTPGFGGVRIVEPGTDLFTSSRRSAIASAGNSREVASALGVNLFEERKLIATLDLIA